jgi:hypothetical protein
MTALSSRSIRGVRRAGSAVSASVYEEVAVSEPPIAVDEARVGMKPEGMRSVSVMTMHFAKLPMGGCFEEFFGRRPGFQRYVNYDGKQAARMSARDLSATYQKILRRWILDRCFNFYKLDVAA